VPARSAFIFTRRATPCELLVDLDTHRGAAALSAMLQKAIGGPVEVEPAVLPAGARDMSSVRHLPVALAVFLAILATGVRFCGPSEAGDLEPHRV
jgi:hypothetical protein